jgi:large subunit ribosomal protein L25
MQTEVFKAEARDVKVKAADIRKQGRIPAVLYGPNVNEHFSVTHNDIKKLVYTPDFKVGEVELGGTNHKCIVKDVQFHPVTDQIRHIDFLLLKEGTKVKVELPVKFKGVSPGVKEGGTLMQSMRKVKVKLDPKDLVDELFVDISELTLGNSIRVKDLEVAKGIEVMVNEATPIASVEIPRALKSAQAAAEGTEEEAAGAEPAAE